MKTTEYNAEGKGNMVWGALYKINDKQGKKYPLEHSDHGKYYPCAEMTRCAPWRQSRVLCCSRQKGMSHSFLLGIPNIVLGIICVAAKHRGFTAQLSRGRRAAKVGRVMDFLCLLTTLYKLQSIRHCILVKLCPKTVFTKYLQIILVCITALIKVFQGRLHRLVRVTVLFKYLL